MDYTQFDNYLNFSQIGQDWFVLEQLRNKPHGFFIDIGSGHPVNINNTFLLEKEFTWNGLSFDYGPPPSQTDSNLWLDFTDIWSKYRTTKLITGDAREHDYFDLFQKYNVPKIVDYLSIDLDPPTVTFEVLNLIPFDKYDFRVITFETDHYRDNSTQLPSRKLLYSYGYKLVKTVNNQEDWYIKDI